MKKLIVLLTYIVNELTFQVNERALVVSDQQILKMDPLKKFKVMESMSLGDVRSVSISPDAGNQARTMTHFLNDNFTTK